MKGVFILALVCAAVILNGCSSTGGTSDPYTTTSGSMYMHGPTTSDPSLPQGNFNADTGPQIPPP